MRYRNYPALGKKVSQLGFGCMRLPCNEDGSVNRVKTTRLFRDFAVMAIRKLRDGNN